MDAGMLIELLGRTSPGAAQLARLASLAARVEPELLRALRVHLLPGVDAGAEADLWFSPLVQAASPLGLVFRPEVLAHLREELAKEENRALLDGAWRTLRAVHEHVPPAVRVEERATWLSLRGAPADQIDAALMPAVSTFAGQQGQGMARWARRVLLRLPAAARETNAAHALDVGAARMQARPLLLGPPPADAARIGEHLTPTPRERITIGVRLLGLGRTAKWEFSHPPAPDAIPFEAARTDPAVIEVSGPAGPQDGAWRRQVLLSEGDCVTVAHPGTDQVTVRAGAGKAYVLDVPRRERPEGTPTATPTATPVLPPGVRLTSTLRGPGDRITGIAWAPDGNQVACAALDGAVHVFEARSRGRRRQLGGEHGGAYALAWSPDGRTLAAGFEDGTLRLWNADTGRPLRGMRHQANTVSCVAWSPDGRTLATGSHDHTVCLWDVQSGALRRTLEGHRDWVRAVAWAPGGESLASAGDDGEVRLWHPDGAELRVLRGHDDWVRCLAWTVDGQHVVSGSDDRTLRVWNAASGALASVLEGHADAVWGLALSGDGRLLASRSADGMVRLWWMPDGSAAAWFREPAPGELETAMAFHPSRPVLAAAGAEDTGIRLWTLDPQVLLRSAPGATVRYATAKVVLLGDSGVGKSSLGVRLANAEFREAASTHGQEFLVMDALRTTRADGTECEAVLWDFAGQEVYRLLHALHLDDVDLALVVFDASRPNPLEGVSEWLRQLSTGSSLPPTILVGARTDRGAPGVSHRDVRDFCRRNGVSGGYVATSARTGEGIAALLNAMRSQIPWDRLAATVTTSAFKQIRDAVVALKKEPGRRKTTVTPAELRQILPDGPSHPRLSDDELLAAVRSLETHGYVTRLRGAAGAERILLAPELLNSVVGSILLEAHRDHSERASVHESQLLRGGYPLGELERVEQEERQLLLDSAVRLLLEHHLCFRGYAAGQALLLFPALVAQRRPDDTRSGSADQVLYVFGHPVETLHSRLVVFLAHTGEFTNVRQWRDEAEYETGTGEVLGFRRIQERAGEQAFVLYGGRDTSPARSGLFRGLVERWLVQQGVEARRFPAAVCPNGHPQAAALVRESMESGRALLYCSVCGAQVSLREALKSLDAGVPDGEVREAEAQARLRGAYETALVQVKAFRRDQEPPRCYINSAPQPAAAPWQTRLMCDLRTAGVEVVEERSGVQDSDFILVVETSVDRKDAKLVASRAKKRGGRETLVRLLLDERDLTFSLEQRQEQLARERTVSDFRITHFPLGTRYPISLFDLVLILYRIPWDHPGFVPLRDALQHQWEEALAYAAPPKRPGPAA